MKKFLTFFTTNVFFYCIAGLALIVIGQTEYIKNISIAFGLQKEFLSTVCRSVGATLIGSGVFTSIIKSSEYSEIFRNVIGDVIWSKDFIKRRSDKRKIWSIVSRFMYEEKFPAISDELEELIAKNYFPITHSYYVEDYDFVVNINDVDKNFSEHTETIKLTIRPSDSNIKVDYSVKTTIDLAPEGIEDISSLQTSDVLIDGVKLDVTIPKAEKHGKLLIQEFGFSLKGRNEYRVVFTKHKILCKISNPDKRIFAKNIINNMKVTAVISGAQDITLHKMGTINDYVLVGNVVNNGVTIKNWEYKGIILPNQGFLGLLK